MGTQTVIKPEQWIEDSIPIGRPIIFEYDI